MKKIEEQIVASQHNMEAVFNSIDTDRSGSITREEFVGALQAMEVNLSEKELNVLFCHLDPSSDNRITLNEFRYMYFNRRRITHVMAWDRRCRSSLTTTRKLESMHIVLCMLLCQVMHNDDH